MKAVEKQKTNDDIVFGKLGFNAKKISPEESQMSMPHSPEEAHDRVASFTFQSRIKGILQPRSKRIDDRVFLVDLTGLRQAYGLKWEVSAAKAHHKIHKILEASLIAHDVYLQRDEASYLVILSGIDLTKAQLKMQLIADDIRAAMSATDKPKIVTIKDVQITWPKSVNFLDTPKRIDIVRDMVAQEDAHREYVFKQSDAEAGKSLFDDVKFIYRPMLAVRTRVISTYVCIPIKPNGHGGFYSGYDMFGANISAENIFDLDSRTQEAVNLELQTIINSNLRSLLALPVHFETLASHHRQQYLTRSRELFQNNTNRIVYELVGVPDHIPQSRMLEFTAALKPYCRAIIARFPITHGAFEFYRSVGLHAVGIDLYAPDRPEKNMFKIMEQFVDNARQTQLRTYAHGVHSVSLYTAAVCSGFDYLDGYALSSVTDSAKDIKTFSYEMLYENTPAPTAVDQ